MGEYDYLKCITDGLDEEILMRLENVYDLQENYFSVRKLNNQHYFSNGALSELDLGPEVQDLQELNSKLSGIEEKVNVEKDLVKGDVFNQLTAYSTGLDTLNLMYAELLNHVASLPQEEEIVDLAYHSIIVSISAHSTMQNLIDMSISKSGLNVEDYDLDVAENIGPYALRKRLEKAIETCPSKKARATLKKIKNKKNRNSTL